MWNDEDGGVGFAMPRLVLPDGTMCISPVTLATLGASAMGGVGELEMNGPCGLAMSGVGESEGRGDPRDASIWMEPWAVAVTLASIFLEGGT
jgi:hypothetical protein